MQEGEFANDNYTYIVENNFKYDSNGWIYDIVCVPKGDYEAEDLDFILVPETAIVKC